MGVNGAIIYKMVRSVYGDRMKCIYYFFFVRMQSILPLAELAEDNNLLENIPGGRKSQNNIHY